MGFTSAISIVLAHGGRPHHFGDLWHTWGRDPLSWAGLIVSAWLYVRGLRRTWAAAGYGHGIRTWEVGCYAAGWLSLFVALCSPIHPWGGVLFSVHMSQHEILMLAAAPLMALGRPLLAYLRALPASWSRELARLSNTRAWRNAWGFLINPLVAWVVHFVALWVWHLPALFDATSRSEVVHALQHLSFLLSALLFWWSIVRCGRTAAGYGAAVLYLFTTAMHNTLLGLLLTFSRTPWYPSYAHTTQSWGLTPLEDQQLGGLVMWVPAGVVYIVAALALLAAWMRESENRVRAREAREGLIGASAVAAAEMP